MKVQELISVLSICDPETEISFEFGYDDEYRQACARLIAEQPLNVDYRDDYTPMLGNLDLSRIDIGITDKEIKMTFEQGYLTDRVIINKIAEISKQRRELKQNG